MTDNEIKLALPFLAKYCKDEYNDIRVDEVLLGASDLINRKEAEIERLETEYESVYEQAKADILGNMADGGTSCHWCIEQHKAEAIKEFAERFTERFIACLDLKYMQANIVRDCKDDLVKEMVGE